MPTGVVLMLTGIDPGLTGTVFAICGIDAPPGQDGSAPSRVNLARSRTIPIPTGIDSPMDRHRCPSESGRSDQMRSRPHSERDRCPKSTGRCLLDPGSALFERSQCLRTPKASLRTRDRSPSEALGCHARPAGSLSRRGRTPLRGQSAHSPARGPARRGLVAKDDPAVAEGDVSRFPRLGTSLPTMPGEPDGCYCSGSLPLRKSSLKRKNARIPEPRDRPLFLLQILHVGQRARTAPFTAAFGNVTTNSFQPSLLTSSVTSPPWARASSRARPSPSPCPLSSLVCSAR